MPNASARHRFGWLAVLGLAGGMAAYGWVRVILPVVRLPAYASPTSYALPSDIRQAAWWDLALPEHRPGPEGGSIRRNLFLYSTVGSEAPPLGTAPKPSDTGPPVVTVQVNETPKPSGPPPPASPLESIQLIGIINAQNGEPAYAVLTDGRELWTALPGQTFGPGVRVVRIQPDSVLLETTDGSHQKTLAFPQKPS